MRSSLRELLFTEDKLYPPRLGNLAAWFDALDTSTMLSSNGTVITDGGQVALWGDKSGNSGSNVLSNYDTGTTNYAYTADVAGRPTTELFIEGRFNLANLAPTTANWFASKWGAAGTRGYFLRVPSTGSLRLGISEDGTNATKSYDASAALSTVTSALAWFYLRVIWRADNGSSQSDCRFYISTDGATWAQLGTTQTSTTSTGIYNGGAGFAVMGSVDASNLLNGQCSYCDTYSNAAGTTVVNKFRPALASKLATSFVSSSGETWTIASSGATGARISGERDLYQGTVANRPIWLQYAGAKYGYCNGVAGNGITTPDSATISITGDLEIIIDVLPDSWSTGSSAAYIAKYVFSTANRSWRLVSATGTRSIQLSWSADGTATVTAAFADHGITSGRQALKVTLDVDNGAGGWTAKLWKAATYLDSWTLVDTQTGVGTTSIYDGTAPLEVGSQNNLATLGVSGKYYYASVASGIGGAPAAIFIPSLYTSGTTFTASTGEVWTVNGGAHIVTRSCNYGDGSNDSLKSAAYSCAQPTTIYWVGTMESWTASDYLFDGNTTNGGALVQTTSTPQVNLNAGSSVAGNTGAALKTWGVFCAVLNGASSTLRWMRLAATTGDAGAGNMNGLTLLARGAADAGWFNGVVGEVAQYSGAHDLATQNRWALYAGRKRGFAV